MAAVSRAVLRDMDSGLEDRPHLAGRLEDQGGICG